MTIAGHSSQLQSGESLFPGYTLEERIGTGGFGEVWRVSAPGGLSKAAKVIYGNVLDERAERELKSLDRVKNVSHPFLLSVERIEVVAGHLVIVTELADKSMKDRYEECRATGLLGIPRSELLGYIQEASDALDYLFAEFDLQHLDVKPENLLLAGGHVRVADFGLLKQLGDRSVSLVSGFTPQYTAPEVLDGRPSPYSDQYSLAVLFQQMATGHMPFDGKTAATVASQHLHSKPDVSVLNPTERYAVSKALAKDPGRRFANCTEFAKRLMHQSGATLLTDTDDARRRPSPHAQTPQSSPSEAPESDLQKSTLDLHRAHDGHTIVVSKPATTTLPALSLDANQPRCRPTLFIGIGGTGGRVLSALRELLGERFGDLAACPAIQFLYIDTDIASLNDTEDRLGSAALREHETLLVPLRNTWDYRTRELNGIASISRRWIYNIPRSRHTEGLRALGRLALLDHSKRILDRLRVAVTDAVDEGALSATATATGLPFDNVDPRVFVVASIAGGTGGGMLLDLGYAARQVLAETGLSDEHVIGLLTYSCEDRPHTESLATANAYALLEELGRFCLPTADYPGEPACGLVGFREPAPTFKSTYLAELHAGLSHDAYAAAIKQLATYLFLSSYSPASAFFDLSRQTDRGRYESGQLSLHTCGVAQLGVDNRAIKPEWIDAVCAMTVRTWLQGQTGYGLPTSGARSPGPVAWHPHGNQGDLPEADRARVESLASGQLHSLDLTLDALTQGAGDHLQRRGEGDSVGGMGGSSALVAAAEDHNSMWSRSRDSQEGRRAVASHLDARSGVEDPLATDQADGADSMRTSATSWARAAAETMGTALSEWLMQLAETDAHRVKGAHLVAKRVGEMVDALRGDAGRRLQDARAARSKIAETAAKQERQSPRSRNPKDGAVAEWLNEYAQRVADEVRAEAVLKTVTMVKHSVNDTVTELWELATELNGLLQDFGARDGGDYAGYETGGNDDANTTCFVSVKEMIAHHDKELVALVDTAIAANGLKTQRTLADMIAPGRRARHAFLELMRGTACSVIRQYRKELAHGRLRAALEEADGEFLRRSIRECVQAATPDVLCEAGGCTRALLVAPRDLEGTRLRENIEQIAGCETTVVFDSGKDVTLCYEVENVSVDNVLNGLVRSRPDCQELALRLHTRIDIDW